MRLYPLPRHGAVVPKKSTQPTLGKQTSPPSTFLSCFNLSSTRSVLKTQIYRSSPDVHGAPAQGLFGQSEQRAGGQGRRGGTGAGSKEIKEESICVDMDFAENYEVWHKIELQSEHWPHNQVTLYIVIAHFRQGGKWQEEAHVFVSADGAHDTFFVQHAMPWPTISKLEASPRLHGSSTLTARPGSQFKNRFTMQSLFSFKTRVGADSVVWETCARVPMMESAQSSLVKRFLRQQEKYNKLYANGPRDVFLARVKHLEEHQNIRCVPVAR